MATYALLSGSSSTKKKQGVERQVLTSEKAVLDIGDLIVDKVETVNGVVPPAVAAHSETILPLLTLVRTEPTSPAHLVAPTTAPSATTVGIDLVAAAAKDRAVLHRTGSLGQTCIVQTHLWQVDAVPTQETTVPSGDQVPIPTSLVPAHVPAIPFIADQIAIAVFPASLNVYGQTLHTEISANKTTANPANSSVPHIVDTSPLSESLEGRTEPFGTTIADAQNLETPVTVLLTSDVPGLRRHQNALH
ncbi:hypothetical protein FKW77_010341 [Venturia effusa]|uniref:Uncharacterized protein n=1 Tax=Venturia effusa TaxID=50376 RepID=A0A517L0H0_9PEZI|nr:hypothetical protein FKW77_010341 [Venturia effusa]